MTMISQKDIVKALTTKCKYLKKEEIFVGKCLTKKARCYWNYLHYQDDPWNDKKINCVRFMVYCKDMDMPTEAVKVAQILENNPGCSMYWVEPSQSVWGKHDSTFFMPDKLYKKSLAGDYSGRWDDIWNQGCEFIVFGDLADMVTGNLITKDAFLQLMKKEIEK